MKLKKKWIQQIHSCSKHCSASQMYSELKLEHRTESTELSLLKPCLSNNITHHNSQLVSSIIQEVNSNPYKCHSRIKMIFKTQVSNKMSFQMIFLINSITLDILKHPVLKLTKTNFQITNSSKMISLKI